jgi:hypothetical protein
VDKKEAERTGQVDGMANDPITLIKEGRIHYRDIPKQQSARGLERLLVRIQERLI